MNRTVLIVEDDLDLREAIGEILEHDRFHVMHAAHGAEAIDILRTSSELPGLILLDLMMPIMNGVCSSAPSSGMTRGWLRSRSWSCRR